MKVWNFSSLDLFLCSQAVLRYGVDNVTKSWNILMISYKTILYATKSVLICLPFEAYQEVLNVWIFESLMTWTTHFVSTKYYIFFLTVPQFMTWWLHGTILCIYHGFLFSIYVCLLYNNYENRNIECCLCLICSKISLVLVILCLFWLHQSFSLCTSTELSCS